VKKRKGRVTSGGEIFPELSVIGTEGLGQKRLEAKRAILKRPVVQSRFENATRGQRTHRSRGIKA